MMLQTIEAIWFMPQHDALKFWRQIRLSLFHQRLGVKMELAYQNFGVKKKKRYGQSLP
jgi:hypothetical protein